MKKLYDYLVGIVFFIVGLGFLISSIFININRKNFQEGAIKTIGVIERIYGEDVYVNFQDLPGEIYQVKLNYYSSTMKVGDEITIYYDKKNPYNFQSEENSILNILFIGMGSLFLLVGGVLIIIPLKKNKGNEDLLKSGIKLSAIISSVSINSSYNVNGRHPYVVYASFKYNDLIYEVKSKNLWFDALNVVESFSIKELPVYIEINNPKRYYLDTSILEQYVAK